MNIYKRIWTPPVPGEFLDQAATGSWNNPWVDVDELAAPGKAQQVQLWVYRYGIRGSQNPGYLGFDLLKHKPDRPAMDDLWAGFHALSAATRGAVGK